MHRARRLAQAQHRSFPRSNLDGCGNGHARDRADAVPKRDRDGLEHCQEWNRQSRFRKSGRLYVDFH
jgi:hypothetical protein